MWNERYQAPGFAYGTEPNDFLVEVEPLLPRHARILSLAEGEGEGVAAVARAVELGAVEQRARVVRLHLVPRRRRPPAPRRDHLPQCVR